MSYIWPEKNTEEFNFVFYKKSEIDGTWENTTEHKTVRDSIKVPTEKGTFVVCLAIVMKSGKSAKYFFAIDVR